MKKFISFLRKQDRQLAAEVAEKYKEFTWVDDEYQTEITEVPLPLPTATPAQPEPEEIYLLDPPPITEQDFDQFKWCLHNINEAPGRTTYILNGEEYNRQLLEYNLLQYTMPPHKRKFIADYERYHLLVDHNETKRAINLHLALHK